MRHRFQEPGRGRVATYNFRRQPDGRLFLDEHVVYEFEDEVQWHDDFDWVRVVTDRFVPDGSSSQEAKKRNPDGSQDVCAPTSNAATSPAPSGRSPGVRRLVGDDPEAAVDVAPGVG